MGNVVARVLLLCVFALVVAVLLNWWAISLQTPAFKHELQVAEAEQHGPVKPWREYQSAVAKFQVDFPGLPQHAQEVRDVPNTDWRLEYQLYVAQDTEGADYMVSMVKYPEQMTIENAQKILDGVLEEMRALNPTHEVEGLDSSDFQGHPSIRFTVAAPDRVLHSRSIVVDHALYLLIVAHAPGIEVGDSIRRFEDSFQLLDIPDEPNKETPDDG